MTTFIHKHPLPDNGEVTLRLRHPGTVLSVAYQGEQLVLWAIENTEAYAREVFFHVMPTGRQLPQLSNGHDRPLQFIGTAMCCFEEGGPYVAHVFREA